MKDEVPLEVHLMTDDEVFTEVPAKPKSPLRWTVLSLSCLMMLGSYYCFDIPSAIKTQIGDYMGADEKEYETYFALMYSLYAIPNVILPFFGGYFVDTFGQCLSLLVSTSFLLAGQIVVSVGFSIKSWYLILAGRFIFALGGENLIVASSALLADWFIGKELAFSFGINLALARVGSVFNNYFSVYLSAKMGVTFANWVGAFICGISVISVIFTMPIDKTFDSRIERAKEALIDQTKTISESTEDVNYGSISGSDVTNPVLSNAAGDDAVVKRETRTSSKVIEDEEELKVSNVGAFTQAWRDMKSLPNIFWVLIGITVITYGVVVPFNNIASSLLLERSYFTATPSGCTLEKSGQCQSGTNQPTCDISSNVAPPLPSDVTINGIYYSGQVPRADVDCGSSIWSSDDSCTYTYCNELAKAENTVSYIMSIPYIISGAASPVFGIIIDYYGCRAALTWASSGILILVHGFLAWSDCSPVIPLIGQGLAYTAFAAVLWPAIPLVVSEELRGLSFGIGTASYNAGCAAVPLIAAAVYTHSGNLYIPNVEILFTIMACFAFALGMQLNFLDWKYFNNVLNRGLADESDQQKPSIGEYEPVFDQGF
jgi:MFS family permease